MSKVDFKKQWKQLYQPSTKEFETVEVPPMSFLMIDGHGDPNTVPAYQEAVEALYAVAYGVKFMSKKELGRDYVVPPLEGIWWAEDIATFTEARDKDSWYWTMMTMVPEWVSPGMYERAMAEVAAKKDPPGLSKIRLGSYHEGLAVQIMHLGSYDAEGPTLARLHDQWLPDNGYVENGRHHEIYLNDPRRVAPEKLKTILRQPIRKG